MSEETKEKIRQAASNRSEDYKLKMSLIKRGLLEPKKIFNQFLCFFGRVLLLL